MSVYDDVRKIGGKRAEGVRVGNGNGNGNGIGRREGGTDGGIPQKKTEQAAMNSSEPVPQPRPQHTRAQEDGETNDGAPRKQEGK